VPEVTEAEMIWNRACGQGRLRSLPGDRALADLLSAHGLVMNGGVLHAVECLTAEELTDAEAGYRFYGFAEVASLLTCARKLFETCDDFERHEQQLSRRYAALIPSDSSILGRFEQRLKSSPSDFMPHRTTDTDGD
jgi:hypothetical protein